MVLWTPIFQKSQNCFASKMVSTITNSKGKSHRLKTPTCSTLRKLNFKFEDFAISNVPSKLNLLLTPLNTDDFDKVHRISLANPHLNLSIRPGRSLASVFDHLKLRWKKVFCEKNMFLLPKSKTSTLKFSVQNPSISLSNLKKEDAEEQEENKTENDPEMEWNFDNSKNLSIGELFLMAGNAQNGTLELSYTFKNASNPTNFAFLSKLATSELSKKCQKPKNPTENGEFSEFRKPQLPLSKPTIQQHQAFKKQLENLMPKYNMRKGRPLSRPKQKASIRPLQPSPNIKSKDGQITKVRLVTQPPPRLITQPPPPTITVTHPVISIQRPENPKNLEIENNNSNDSLSAALSFFDTSRHEFLDSVLENSNNSVLQTPPRPPVSPWMHNEDSVQSTGSEVDRQLLSMMTENSVDFTSKFAKLASAVVGNNSEEN